MKGLIAALLVTIVILLGVIAYAVTRPGGLSDQEQLECAVAADYGQMLPYPECEDYLS